jgi:hypothetical protein
MSTRILSPAICGWFFQGHPLRLLANSGRLNRSRDNHVMCGSTFPASFLSVTFIIGWLSNMQTVFNAQRVVLGQHRLLLGFMCRGHVSVPAAELPLYSARKSARLVALCMLYIFIGPQKIHVTSCCSLSTAVRPSQLRCSEHLVCLSMAPSPCYTFLVEQKHRKSLSLQPKQGMCLSVLRGTCDPLEVVCKEGSSL